MFTFTLNPQGNAGTPRSRYYPKEPVMIVVVYPRLYQSLLINSLICACMEARVIIDNATASVVNKKENVFI
jgi:hypothetical protein